MVVTQITRRKNADTSETLIRKSDGSTLPYSAPNLTTILSGVIDPLFVIQKVGHPFTFQARNQTEFTTANFGTVWDLLLSNPDQPFGKL
ncbi:MAG: hypothetical protein WBM37_09255 [Nitrososphaeraceae archaeon]